MRGAESPWSICDVDDVKNEIKRRAGVLDFSDIDDQTAAARETVLDCKETLVSILSAALAPRDDPYLRDLKTKVADTFPKSWTSFARAVTPRRKIIMSRDQPAIDGGFTVSPHHEILGLARSYRAVYDTARALCKSAAHAADHLGRTDPEKKILAEAQPGSRVFLGHGKSSQWREVKDFVQDRLGIQVDEFNRVPVAGITNIDRLSQMLDNAAFAFLVMTAEDQTAEGLHTARANVIHEVGLFQGRLGFARAIVLLEKGCEEFSNIQGLGQIRYPEGNIKAAFEDIRQVLEREGLA